jgi:tRNA pseudouridine55 synthase
MKDGILVVDKPKGITSHDVVDFVRKRLKIRRVGHSGTLDPIATGVLLILIGRATKLFSHFLGFDKEYVATLTLGSKTTTGDITGRIIETKDFKQISEVEVNAVFMQFQGERLQVPPMFSALKYKGKRLYLLAQRGIEIERTGRPIVVKELKLLDFNLPDIKFYLRCSKGTYVRTIAEDIAYTLGSLGHISQIERQAIGPFKIQGAISLDKIDESHIRSYYFTRDRIVAQSF